MPEKKRHRRPLAWLSLWEIHKLGSLQADAIARASGGERRSALKISLRYPCASSAALVSSDDRALILRLVSPIDTVADLKLSRFLRRHDHPRKPKGTSAWPSIDISCALSSTFLFLWIGRASFDLYSKIDSFRMQVRISCVIFRIRSTLVLEFERRRAELL